MEDKIIIIAVIFSVICFVSAFYMCKSVLVWRNHMFDKIKELKRQHESK